MASTDGGKAASSNKTTTQTDRAQAATSNTSKDIAGTNDPARDMTAGERMLDGQKMAKEAQLTIAERRPDENVADPGQVAGEEGAGQLSDWEKRSSGYDGDDIASRDDMVKDAALTPAEKAELNKNK